MKHYHWKLSCFVNMILFGSPKEPFCSRVYRNDYRLLINALDWWFGNEYNKPHCQTIFRKMKLIHLSSVELKNDSVTNISNIIQKKY